MLMQPHTAEWYDRLAALQPGYYHPWRSRLGAWNGEDVDLLKSYTVGGHGDTPPRKIASYKEAWPTLERILAEHGDPDEVAVRHSLSLWKAIVPG